MKIIVRRTTLRVKRGGSRMPKRSGFNHELVTTPDGIRIERNGNAYRIKDFFLSGVLPERPKGIMVDERGNAYCAEDYVEYKR
jgi:hypothetical protein